jgi:hypothetical protein
MVFKRNSKSIAVTVIADGKSKVYGDENLRLLLWLLVLSGGDTINYTLATTASLNSNGISYCCDLGDN